MLTKDNLVNSSFDETYTYDGLNQLAMFAQGSSHTQDFNYDSLGNFDSVTTDGGTPQARSANDQNEITSISGATTPTYDANGNMTGDQTGLTFVYDAWNRMVGVKSGSTTLETFSYDGENRRITNTISGTTTDLHYSSQWQVLEEQVGGSDMDRYVWSPVYVNAMVLRDRATTTPGTLNERFWVQQDANWDTTALVDGSGTVQERYTYDPYGVFKVYDGGYTVRGGGSSYASVYLFQGMRSDSIIGLDAADMRWYSPSIEGWANNDPMLFRGGNSRLNGFESDSPCSFTDPTGLYKVEMCFKSIGPGIYHAYIVVTDTDGSRYFFRAGPYKNPPFKLFGSSLPSLTPNKGTDPTLMMGTYGILYPEHGAYLPVNPPAHGAAIGSLAAVCIGTSDYTTAKRTCITVVDKPGEAAKATIQKLIELSKNVRYHKIEYKVLGPNSNSYAYQLSHALNNQLPMRPVIIAAPGYDVPIDITPPPKK